MDAGLPTKDIDPNAQYTLGGDFLLRLAQLANQARITLGEGLGGEVSPGGTVIYNTASPEGHDDPDIILVRNDTKYDLPAYSVVSLDSLVTDDQTVKAAVTASPTLTAKVPTEDQLGHFAILRRDIPADSIGPALVSGQTPVQIDVQQEADGFADTVSDDTSKLKSHSHGGARILWKESGTGKKWAIVNLAKSQTSPTMTTFTSAGSQTWTVPDGVREVLIFVVGGGGAGGNKGSTRTVTDSNGDTFDFDPYAGGGGGSGGAILYLAPAKPKDEWTIEIGEGAPTGSGVRGDDSTVTFPNGEFVRGTGGATASGEDGGIGGAPYADFQKTDNTFGRLYRIDGKLFLGVPGHYGENGELGRPKDFNQVSERGSGGPTPLLGGYRRGPTTDSSTTNGSEETPGCGGAGEDGDGGIGPKDGCRGTCILVTM